MQRTQRLLRKVNIFAPSETAGNYVGKKIVPELVGFVYAEVFPEKSELKDERDGKRTTAGATLIMRREAGVKCGDLASVYGDEADSRVISAQIYPGHLTVRTERL